MPFEPIVVCGETRPGSGWPYILGSFPYIPSVSAFWAFVCDDGDGDARRKLGIGEFGSWGVVGHGGVSVFPFEKMEVVELRGSNMAAPRCEGAIEKEYISTRST